MEDVRLVADGRVSPVLLWEKHPLRDRGGAYARAHPAFDAAPAAVFARRADNGLAAASSGAIPAAAIRSEPPPCACHRELRLL